MVRIDWNPDAFYGIRRDPAVVSMLDAKAKAVADWCNANGKGTYATGSQQGRRAPQGRWRASVVTADAKAIAHNAKHHTLIRGLGAAGGS